MSNPPMAKTFINKPEDIVQEALEGLVHVVNPGRLAKLPGHDVVLRADVSTAKDRQVTLLSGGGSGHEPAFAGYVGEGMLTAAVCGDVFTSPSSSAVLAAIRATCGPSGCLVLVMNYTGDRLNFGIAVEQAKAEGFDVRMLVVGDDCALARTKGITGRRGLAGTVLVVKIAGAAAEAGLSLQEVMAEADGASKNIGTLGIALATCTLPGQQPSHRLDANTIEIGLGIHGEAGKEQTQLESADSLTDRMVMAIVGSKDEGGQDYLPLPSGQRVAVLVNSLGATSPMELLVVARRAAEGLAKRGAVVERVYCGSFMTSLDMKGVSLSVMRVDPLSLSRLDASVDTPGWRDAHGTRFKRPPAHIPRSMKAASTGTAKSKKEAAAEGRPVIYPGEWSRVEGAIRAAARALINAEPDLTKWDTVAGDADCGTTFKRGAEALIAALDASALPKADLRALLRALAESVGDSMGGTMGGILQIFFTAGEAGLSSGVGDTESSDAWCEAFAGGVDGIEYYGGAKAGMRTVLDAVVPAADVLRMKGSQGFEEAVKAAEEGAESTCSMGALAGRSNYVCTDLLNGIPDPGAKAAAYALRAVRDSLALSID